MDMVPIQIHTEWDDNGIVLLEVFPALIKTPLLTVHEWLQQGRGPHFWRFNGTGKPYTTVGEIRRFLRRAA